MSSHAVRHFTTILGPTPPWRVLVTSTTEWFQTLTLFRSGFYKSAWSILGTEVTASIQNFFHTSFMPAAVNSTILSLIPKHPGASLITDFRPISCLNTVYKVISRLLVKRLKPILPSLILPCHGTSSSLVSKASNCLKYLSLGCVPVSAPRASRWDITGW